MYVCMHVCSACVCIAMKKCMNISVKYFCGLSPPLCSVHALHCFACGCVHTPSETCRHAMKKSRNVRCLFEQCACIKWLWACLCTYIQQGNIRPANAMKKSKNTSVCRFFPPYAVCMFQMGMGVVVCTYIQQEACGQQMQKKQKHIRLSVFCFLMQCTCFAWLRCAQVGHAEQIGMVLCFCGAHSPSHFVFFLSVKYLDRRDGESASRTRKQSQNTCEERHAIHILTDRFLALACIHMRHLHM